MNKSLGSADLQLGAFAVSSTDAPLCAPTISPSRLSRAHSPRRVNRARSGFVAAAFRAGAFPKFLGAIQPSTLSVAALILSAVAIGCAAPGEPYERKAPTPVAITDLTAVQFGSEVQLTFTLPQQSLDKRPLQALPTIEIYRDFFKPPAPGEPAPKSPASPTLLVTIPSAMEDRYFVQGHIHFTDTFGPHDFEKHPDSLAVYTVRTQISEKKPSANSNVASVHVFAPFDAIADLTTQVTQAGIVLSWTPPARTLAGATLSVGVYHIYRGVPDPFAAPGDPSKLKSPLVKIADAQAPPFEDTQFEFGASYVYSVRSVAQYPDASVESSDSNLAALTPRDTFPPASPQELIVVLVPAQGDASAHLELSWAISPETDVAGYNVYRSEQEGTQGSRINMDLLLTPAFRDMNTQPGHRYFYTVTAVDRAGNESPASAAASSGVPASGQANP
jgi:hypothetical protein